MFDSHILEAARKHAVREFPRESVGYVSKGEYHAQENLSDKPEDAFFVAKESWVRLALVEAVIHSHPVTEGKGVRDYPSRVDMERQIATAVPWGIITCDSEQASEEIVWFGDQVPRRSLLGESRYFRHGVTDCYSLIRDFYLEELGIFLKDFPREWGWWNGNDEEGFTDLYQMGFTEAGFTRVPLHDVKKYDLFFARLPRIPTVCHGGIYLGGSGEMIVHHICSGKPVDVRAVARKQPGVHYMDYVAFFARHEEMFKRYRDGSVK